MYANVLKSAKKPEASETVEEPGQKPKEKPMKRPM